MRMTLLMKKSYIKDHIGKLSKKGIDWSKLNLCKKSSRYYFSKTVAFEDLKKIKLYAKKLLLRSKIANY